MTESEFILGEPQELDVEKEPDRRIVNSVVELATQQGPVGLDDMLKFVDPDLDPATFDLLEAELSSRGLIITPDDVDDDDEISDIEAVDGSVPSGVLGRGAGSGATAIDDLACTCARSGASIC
jgi:hypothetical protein